MTEFWKSNERYFCEVCGCWMDGKARARKMHEEGKGHQENYIAKQKALREKKAAEAKSQKTEAAQWASLDEAATAAYERDLIAQGKIPPPRAGASSTAAAAAPAHAAPKPKPSHAHHSYPPPPSAAPSAAASAAAAKPSLWQPTLDPTTGATYYFNIQTLATSWTNPDEEARIAKAAAAEAEAKEKRERKQAAATAAKQVEGAAAGAESKEESEPKSKKQRTDSAAPVSSSAASSTPASSPAAPVEIDEDTGFGRWESVAVVAEPSAAERAAAAAVPRMTPFGMTTPDALSAAAAGSASGAAATAKPEVAAHWANSNHAADDSADADEDDGAPVDMAQQLRKQFGNSKLISSRTTLYEPGQNLLQDDEADAAAVAAAATATISFKKKRDRSANIKKPVAATNK